MSDTTPPPEPLDSVQISRQLDALYAAFREGAFGDWTTDAVKQQWQIQSGPLIEQLHTAAAAEYDAAVTEGGLRSVNTPVVAAGELIESAWGNQVRADLLNHDASINRLTGDTGWVTMTVQTGFTGTFIYRRVGSIVTVAFSLTRDGVNLGELDIGFGTIPEIAARPSATISGAAFVSNPRDVTRVLVTASSGQIRCNPLTINSGAYVAATLTYPVSLP